MPLFLVAAVPAVWGWVAGAGAAVAVAAGVSAYHSSKKDEAYADGKRAGAKAGEAVAQEKYKSKLDELTRRLRGYHDFEDKVLGMYAVGLAVAAADGEICRAERQELDEFVAGCLSEYLPQHVRESIAELTARPPGLTEALKYAAERNVPKKDIDDIIELVARADDQLHPMEKRFVTRWRNASANYEQRLKAA